MTKYLHDGHDPASYVDPWRDDEPVADFHTKSDEFDAEIQKNEELTTYQKISNLPIYIYELIFRRIQYRISLFIQKFVKRKK